MSSSCREAVEFLSSFLSSSRGLGWSRTPTATTAVITKGYHLTRLRRTAGHRRRAARPPRAPTRTPTAHWDRVLKPRSAFRRALHPECRRFTTTRPYCLLQYSLTATRCIGELRPMLHAVHYAPAERAPRIPPLSRARRTSGGSKRRTRGDAAGARPLSTAAPLRSVGAVAASATYVETT